MVSHLTPSMVSAQSRRVSREFEREQRKVIGSSVRALQVKNIKEE